MTSALQVRLDVSWMTACASRLLDHARQHLPGETTCEILTIRQPAVWFVTDVLHPVVPAYSVTTRCAALLGGAFVASPSLTTGTVRELITGGLDWRPRALFSRRHT